MITQAGLELLSAPQLWLARSSASDSCFDHVPKVGAAFQPPTQPWEGGERRQREKGAGLILSVCLLREQAVLHAGACCQHLTH